MNPLTFVAVALTLAAPPPKSVDHTGRITLWLDDKYEFFKPDGEDVTSLPVPSQLPVGMRVTPDRKAYVWIDRSATAVKQAILPQAGQAFGKLVVTPLGDGGPSFTVDGYFANYLTGTIHGTRVYFTGGKGEEITEAHTKAPASFVLELATKAVTPIPVSEKHTLFGVSPDGKLFLTTRIDTDNNTYSRRTFLLAAGGKPVEILKDNIIPTMLTFSPDGSKLLALTTEYTDVTLNGNGGVQMGGAKPREFRILDTATNATKPLRYTLSDDNYLTGWDWSPDGTKIVLCTYDRTSGATEIVPIPGGKMQQMQFVYKVSVADADGGNPKEVYRTRGATVKSFMWK
jgi:WD40 repeat protein